MLLIYYYSLYKVNFYPNNNVGNIPNTYYLPDHITILFTGIIKRQKKL